MKSILSALLIFAAAPVMASDIALNYDGGGASSEVEVLYASWCVDNQVVFQGLLGEIVVRDNCSDKGLTCLASEQYRGRRVIHSATCAAE